MQGAARLRFKYLFEPLGMNAQGFMEYRHRQTGIVMVRLPGRKFWMGAQKTDPGSRHYTPEAADEEGPVHEVALGPFLIGAYEVTQAEWKSIMGTNPSDFIQRGFELPVESVSWDDAHGFCEKTGLSLPTEAQWEYACRARLDSFEGMFGRPEDNPLLHDRSETYPIGYTGENGYGLFDMIGNVQEWCEDIYNPSFYGHVEAGDDPVCRSGSEMHVIRGGSWRHAERVSVPEILTPPIPEILSPPIGVEDHVVETTPS